MLFSVLSWRGHSDAFSHEERPPPILAGSGCQEKVPQTERLKEQLLFSQPWRLEVGGRGASRAGFWRGLSPWFSAFLLSPHLAETALRGLVLFSQGTGSVDQYSPLRTLFNPNSPWKALSPICHLGVRASTYGFEGGTIQFGELPHLFIFDNLLIECRNKSRVPTKKYIENWRS